MIFRSGKKLLKILKDCKYDNLLVGSIMTILLRYCQILLHFLLFLPNKQFKIQICLSILTGNIHFLPKSKEKMGTIKDRGKYYGIWGKTYTMFWNFFSEQKVYKIFS